MCVFGGDMITLLGSSLRLLSSGAGPAASDWAQWRGPSRDGHAPGFTAPAVWPRALARTWSVPVGEGHASPIIVGERAYVLVRRGETEHTLCLDMATGKTLWEDTVAAPFDSVIFPAQRLGKAPRSTPLWNAGKLYTTGVNGLLTCFDAGSGKVLWRKDFSTQFPVPMPICGASLSPLIDGQTLYLHVGHDDSGAFLALDKDTGRERWSWKGEGPGYTSPVLARIDGTPQLITAAHNRWIGLDPRNGALLWSLPVRQNTFNHNSITPVVVGDTVICGANQRPTFALKLTRSGATWSVSKLWETRDVTMSTSSPVLSGDRIYAVTEKRRGQIVCLSLSTGETRWSCPGNKGEQVSLIDIGPSVLALASDGQLFVYKKTADGLAETARYPVAKSAVWAGPALSRNRILVKDTDTLTLWTVPTR
jgi:outer membrane protein assembly factor BamB